MKAKIEKRIDSDLNEVYIVHHPGGNKSKYADKINAYYEVYVSELGLYEHEKLSYINFMLLFGVFSIMMKDVEVEIDD